MNYRNFLLLAERYYKPTEKLPSGSTPLEKAMYRNVTKPTPAQRHPLARLYSPNPVSPQEAKRREVQKQRIPAVRRGADNPNFDTTPHKDLDIDHNAGYTEITHKPSGVRYSLSRGYSPEGNKYTVSWGRSNPNEPMSSSKVIKGAKDAWRLIEPRIPHGTILHNKPLPNIGSEKNTRAKMYSRFGFSGLNAKGDQYARVGRPPSPRQAKSGVTRTRPYDPQRSKISGNLGTNTDQNYNIPTTGNPLLDRNRRRLPGSQGPAGVRLAD